MSLLAANYLATQRADVGFEGVNIQGTPSTNSLVLLSGNTILGGDLSVTGTANLSTAVISNLVTSSVSAPTISASTGLIGALLATGATITTASISDLTVSTATHQNGTLLVSGAAVFTGPVDMSLLAANYLATQRADVGFEGVNIQGTPGDNSLVLLSGNTILGGDLSVTGTANLSTAVISNLVTSSVSAPIISASTGLIGALLATGATITTASVSDLTVSTATHQNGSLLVAGAAVFTGPVDMSLLAANYLATQRADVGFEGVNIQGTPSTNSLVLLSGNTILGGDLSVTGTANLSTAVISNLITSSLSAPTISATTGLIGALVATGATITTVSVSDLTVSTATHQNGSLLVSGASVFTGPVDMSLLAANYLATQRADVGFEGVNIQGTPSTNSLVLLSGNTILGGDLGVTGTVNLSTAVISDATVQTLHVPTSLLVNGTSTFTGAVSVSNLSAFTALVNNLTAEIETVTQLNMPSTGSMFTINGNMSGANIFTTNLASENGFATQELTVGYNGMTVVGLNSTESMVVIAGDAVFGGNELGYTGAISNVYIGSYGNLTLTEGDVNIPHGDLNMNAGYLNLSGGMNMTGNFDLIAGDLRVVDGLTYAGYGLTVQSNGMKVNFGDVHIGAGNVYVTGTINSAFNMTAQGNVSATQNVYAGRHINTTTTMYFSNTGTAIAPYVTDVLLQGNDIAGYFEFNFTGTATPSPAPGDQLLLIGFNAAYDNIPSVVLFPTSRTGANFIRNNNVYVDQNGGGGFFLTLGNDIDISTDYDRVAFNYQVIDCPRTTISPS
jgi:hypothetical protein